MRVIEAIVFLSIAVLGLSMFLWIYARGYYEMLDCARANSAGWKRAQELHAEDRNTFLHHHRAGEVQDWPEVIQ